MQITLRYIIAFLLLCLLIQEAHEIAHMLVDKGVNGCGGVRYFLYWQLCETGDKNKVAITAFAGPFIDFLFMWLGYTMITSRATARQKSYGFTFIMATLPLQRLQAFVFRGSDEITALKKLLSPNQPFKGAAVTAGLLLIALLVIPPLYKAFKYTPGKNKWLIIIAFLTVPFFISILLQHLAAGPSVRAFLLSSTGFALMPSWLVLLDLLLLFLFLPFAKSMGRLFSR